MNALLRTIFKIILGISGLATIAIVALGIYLSKDKELSQRHQPFDEVTPFNFSNTTFDNYIDHAQKTLRSGRLDSLTKEFIQNASPFALTPSTQCQKTSDGRYKNGIVLTHGLIASPYSMRPIAEYFQSRCFYVLATMLPHHVTRPGNMLNANWQDWTQTQDFAINILRPNVENIYLAGHSMGGEIALYGAATNSDIKGLILFTPGMKITPAAKYAKYLSWLGKLFPKAAWFEVRADHSLYRYESVSFSAARESYNLIQATNNLLAQKPLSIPIFTVVSAEDNTVDTKFILKFMAAQTHPASKTLLYSQHPVPSTGKVKVRLSAIPEQGILSVSHLGIMLSADHAEYGSNGAYRSCGHYFNEPKKHELCSRGKREFYGEVTPENLQKGLIERIAFNPFYDELLLEIDEFLKNSGADIDAQI